MFVYTPWSELSVFLPACLFLHRLRSLSSLLLLHLTTGSLVCQWESSVYGRNRGFIVPAYQQTHTNRPPHTGQPQSVWCTSVTSQLAPGVNVFCACVLKNLRGWKGRSLLWVWPFPQFLTSVSLGRRWCFKRISWVWLLIVSVATIRVLPLDMINWGWLSRVGVFFSASGLTCSCFVLDSLKTNNVVMRCSQHPGLKDWITSRSHTYWPSPHILWSLPPFIWSTKCSHTRLLRVSSCCERKIEAELHVLWESEAKRTSNTQENHCTTDNVALK